ncbi:MAG TPA: hypothetical protein VHC94_12560 [Nitrobacter sp.]|nr:hypothetical protein [Nitrobacter sp.]
MRIVLVALLVLAGADVASAQTVLKSEPLFLAPYEVVHVHDLSCPGGVRKVVGAMRGLHRKRTCLPAPEEQASRVDATP